ncbi:hypothetical protein NQF86_02815 [Bombella sp. TMW 2.2543]|uniref:Uncharacterized protein n=1 Tax=Bombella pluederhausensis TaxID=2967336 RepID=A0ABT3WL93_9PROT|nr:hypothetical protein [Bombella pluederhausensis]MCX5617606.1 hypothetical protein [Bombella pluederhausensis]
MVAHYVHINASSFQSPPYSVPCCSDYAGRETTSATGHKYCKLAGGFGSTLLTGSQGLTQTNNSAPKTLLGGCDHGPASRYKAAFVDT